MRTLRHPGVIKIFDTVEVLLHLNSGNLESMLTDRKTDSYIYIATERVTPLEWSARRKSLSPEASKWGLYVVAVCSLRSPGRFS